MRRKIIVGLIAVALVVSALPITGCAPAKEEEPEVYNWSWFLTAAPDWIEAKCHEGLVQKVKEQSEGRLDIKLCYLGELPYKIQDQLPVVRDGLVEVSDVMNIAAGGVLDWLEISALPFIFEGDRELAVRVNREVIKSYTDRYFREHMNCFVAQVIVAHPNVLLASKEVTCLDDVNGLVIRAAPPTQQAMLRKLGATPEVIDFGEVYTALQRGTIDGAITGLASAGTAGWWEVCPWVHLWNITFAQMAVTVNLDAFNQLPKDLQEIFLECVEEEEPLAEEMFWEAHLQGLEEAKAEIEHLTPLSSEDEVRLREIGDLVEQEWINQEGRSQEALELYQLVKEAVRKWR